MYTNKEITSNDVNSTIEISEQSRKLLARIMKCIQLLPSLRCTQKKQTATGANNL